MMQGGFAGLNRAIGEASYGLIDSLTARDVGERAKRIGGDMAAADMVFRALENKAYKERLQRRKDYLSQVMGEIDPKLAGKRAGRSRTGFGGRAAGQLAMARARGGGDLAVLDVSRSLREGAASDWVERLRRAGATAEENVGEMTGRLQEGEMDYQDYLRKLRLAENVYGAVSQSRMRAGAADAAHTSNLREVFAGWFSPY
jgi:hypothetical protein